eukprot:SAG11_NODE_2226_length_3663_cov_1.716891_2_plen_260_part_00
MDALRVESLHGLNLNKFLLFRGDKSDMAGHLHLQGFDPRLAGTGSGKMFSLGTYLACKSSKSDIYTEPNGAGERCVHVVRTCLGEPHKAVTSNSQMTVPPQRTSGNPGRLNSVVGLTEDDGGVLQHPKYIVYNAAQALPQYVIWYRHGLGCACTHCAHVQVSMPDGSRVRLKASRHDNLNTVRKLLRHAKALEGAAVRLRLAGGDAPQTTRHSMDTRGKTRAMLEQLANTCCRSLRLDYIAGPPVFVCTTVPLREPLLN